MEMESNKRLQGAGNRSSAATEPPVRAILMDFGGVLAEEGFREGLKAFAREQGLDPESFFEAGREEVYRTGYALGRANQATFFEALRRRYGFEAPDSALEQAILSRFIPRRPMLELVVELRRAGYLCILLTDQTDWLNRLDSRFDFLRLFDLVFNSYRTGKSKHDPFLFDHLAHVLDLEPEQMLLVDDSPDHLARAASRGVRTLQFDMPEQGIKALRDLLRLKETADEGKAAGGG